MNMKNKYLTYIVLLIMVSIAVYRIIDICVYKGEMYLKKIVCLASEEAPIKTENDTLGSTAFTPPVGGLLIAGYIINDIIK